MNMKTSETTDKLIEALAKAQGVFKNPEKNKTVTVNSKTGASYSYSYADLPTIFDASRKGLSENGLAFTFTITPFDKILWLTCRLMHTSGQFLDSSYPLNSGDSKTMAGEITYWKRYLFCGLIGMAAEEDTDENPEPGSTYKDKEKKPSSNIPLTGPIPGPTPQTVYNPHPRTAEARAAVRPVNPNQPPLPSPKPFQKPLTPAAAIAAQIGQSLGEPPMPDEPPFPLAPWDQDLAGYDEMNRRGK